jgi:hypothetical protein
MRSIPKERIGAARLARTCGTTGSSTWGEGAPHLPTESICPHLAHRFRHQHPPCTETGDKLPDSSGSPHLFDIKGLGVFRAAVGNYVKGVGTADTLQQAWRRLPSTIQQRAMVIAQEHGFEEWFEALVG